MRVYSEPDQDLNLLADINPARRTFFTFGTVTFNLTTITFLVSVIKVFNSDLRPLPNLEKVFFIFMLIILFFIAITLVISTIEYYRATEHSYVTTIQDASILSSSGTLFFSFALILYSVILFNQKWLLKPEFGNIVTGISITIIVLLILTIPIQLPAYIRVRKTRNLSASKSFSLFTSVSGVFALSFNFLVFFILFLVFRSTYSTMGLWAFIITFDVLYLIMAIITIINTLAIRDFVFNFAMIYMQTFIFVFFSMFGIASVPALLFAYIICIVLELLSLIYIIARHRSVTIISPTRPSIGYASV